MTRDVFSIRGRVSGVEYGSICVPEADDYETAQAINLLYDAAKVVCKWAKTESLEANVRDTNITTYTVPQTQPLGGEE